MYCIITIIIIIIINIIVVIIIIIVIIFIIIIFIIIIIRHNLFCSANISVSRVLNRGRRFLELVLPQEPQDFLFKIPVTLQLNKF